MCAFVSILIMISLKLKDFLALQQEDGRTDMNSSTYPIDADSQYKYILDRVGDVC